MRITDSLLDEFNGTVSGETTIGKKIVRSGKEHLWEPRAGTHIDTVVIHYISAVQSNSRNPYNLASLLDIFCSYGVSSHYLISRRGKVYRLVPEDRKAWHAGKSIMPSPDDRTGVNEFSVGVELMATENSGFSSLQYRSLCRLCADMERRYGKKMKYVGHDQIAGSRAVEMGLRGEPKPDPGPRFDWDYFRESLEWFRSGL
ncbi:MAG: N-acetylmuramoyl-L-alanine amidase [Chitinispirillaceae bacterium]